MKICQACSKKYQNSISYCPNDGQKLVEYRVFVGAEQDPFIDMLIEKKYHIEAKIAQGGMGNIYLANHLQLDMPVAVKVMHERFVRDANAVRRFRREAQSAMQIRHTNAITVMDFGVTDTNHVYLVMEYLQGMSLREKLLQQPLLPLKEINIIMQQVCAAVKVAHRRGLIHRDLKPENIFLQRDGESEVVKVLDFGIAKSETIPNAQRLNQDIDLTRSGNVVLGSPKYMSPEQCGEESIDVRSDVYSLGIILYELLTGELPFSASTLPEMAFKHMNELPRPVRSLRPEIPPAIEAVVMRALEKDRVRRQEDAGAFGEEMENVFSLADAAVQRQRIRSTNRLTGSTSSVDVLSDGVEWPSLSIPTAVSHFESSYPIDLLFLPEVFGLLMRERASGTAWFSSGLTIKGVYWRNGQISLAVSNDLSEQLGERLVRQGRMHRSQLNEAIRWKNQRGASIMDAFIALGYFTQEILMPLLSRHVYSVCYSIMEWEEGCYVFDPSPSELPMFVSISAVELVMEVVRSVLDLGRVKAFLGAIEQVTLVQDDWILQTQFTLRQDEMVVFNQFKTAQSLTQVIAGLDLPDEQVIRTVCGLLAIGALKRIEVEPLPVVDVEAMALFYYEVENMLAQINRPDNDYYAILGVSRRASVAEINAAYTELQARFDVSKHQDIIAQMPLLTTQLETICSKLAEAQRRLSDPKTRNEYTQSLKRQSGQLVVPFVPPSPVSIVANSKESKSKPTPIAKQPIPVTKPLSVSKPVVDPLAAMGAINPASPKLLSDPTRLRNADDWYLFGLELIDRGDPERAARAFHNAIKLQPRDAEFHAALARTYEELYGYNKQTIQKFEEAISLQPKSADYQAELGIFYLKHNQLELAKRYIDSALALDGNNRIARKAKERLSGQKVDN